MRPDHAEQLRELDAEIRAATAALTDADTAAAKTNARRELHALAARVSADMDHLRERNTQIDARALQIIREATERRHGRRLHG